MYAVVTRSRTFCYFCVPWWQNLKFWVNYPASSALDGLPTELCAEVSMAAVTLLFNSESCDHLILLHLIECDVSFSFPSLPVVIVCFSVVCHFPHRESSAGICEEICLWLFFLVFAVVLQTRSSRDHGVIFQRLHIVIWMY